MSNEQETVADIIAEKRNRANEIERDVAAKMANGEMVSDQYAREVIAGLRKEADRLEAAAKREEEHAVEHATRHAEAVARDNCRDCVHNPQGHNYEGGNAKAMREYAKRLVDAVKDADLCDFIYGSNFCKSCMYNPMCKAARDCEAALSAPIKNCDRFGDWDEAAAEYERLVAEGKAEDGTWGEWLFSTGPYAGCHAGNGAEAEGGGE